jgi:predicted GNAT superfamily acetyltransferase
MIARAKAHYEAAATRAGLEVRVLTTTAELSAAAQLITDVWGAPFSDHVLRALELTGNYVSGAFASGGSLVGASVAFAALAEERELHSHITGVLPRHQGSGAGVALKLHQRWWALERNIETITWTFDPLVRRNAAFNLARLGATAGPYLENLYGSMDDDLNRDDESDRLFVRWSLLDPVVEAASAGTPLRIPVPPALPQALRPGPDGAPLVSLAEGPGCRSFSCAVPDDIQMLRAGNLELAKAWRLAVRQVLGGALSGGGRLLGLDGSGDYVVETGFSGSGTGTA